ncbi:MAG: hypothetical protein ACKO2K_05270 [Alphaproteobacteria bacterium]
MAAPSGSTPKPAGATAAARKAAVGAPVKQDYNFTTLLPKGLNIDFVGKRKFFLILSTLLNLAAIGLLLTRGLNLGIDFKGGTDIRLRFAEPTTAAVCATSSRRSTSATSRSRTSASRARSSSSASRRRRAR